MNILDYMQEKDIQNEVQHIQESSNRLTYIITIFLFHIKYYVSLALYIVKFYISLNYSYKITHNTLINFAYEM